MQIDLNDPAALTIEAVRGLLASKDDSQDRQLRVSNDGIVYLSDTVGNEDIDNLAFRLETWDAGNSYCGAAAAADDKWVNEVFKNLKKKLAQP